MYVSQFMYLAPNWVWILYESLQITEMSSLGPEILGHYPSHYFWTFFGGSSLMVLVFVKNTVEVCACNLSAYGTILFTDEDHLLCLFWFLLCFWHYETPGPFNDNFCEAHEFCDLYFQLEGICLFLFLLYVCLFVFTNGISPRYLLFHCGYLSLLFLIIDFF